MTPAGSDAQQFEDAVRTFADAMAAGSKSMVVTKPEDQLNDPVRALLRACGDIWNWDVDSRQQVKAEGIGWPDLGVTTKGLLSGHVELKAPDVGARPEKFRGQNRDQWKRYQALPNLIYTDGSEWSLYHSGKRAKRVRIADDIRDGGSSINSGKVAALRDLLRRFLESPWEAIAPKSASGLAKFLAPLARYLRDEVRDALTREVAPLEKLMSDWQDILFAEADVRQFADAYAQTLTYALLLAHFEGAHSLRPAQATETLQDKHMLLAEALQLLEAPIVRAELRVPVELLERAIEAVDIEAVRSRSDDPWLYFYEQFLQAYDARLRKNRGVYFTPAQVVQLQVRLAAELLRERFGKPLAFAEEGVTVLDPAVGTGAYPIAVIDHAASAVDARFGRGGVPARITSLADRLHGFEILVGPYSVAHLRVTQQLAERGVSGQAARIYLADTLESPYRQSEFTASILQARIAEERELAREIKLDARVLVCLGNPPYDREQHDAEDTDAKRKGGWVREGDKGSGEEPILEAFLQPVKEADEGGHLKNLYNDYVYFWRWALWKVFDSTDKGGIVTFITASSYLHGPGFGGMRRKMREVFDDLWIIDLQGDSRGTRKTENIFAIATPVAIAIGIRNGQPNPQIPARVWKTRFTGTAEEKLAKLDATESLEGLRWRQCQTEWSAPFFPVEAGDYDRWPAITDVFPWQQSGVKAGRTWPISPDQETLKGRWRDLVSAEPVYRRTLFVDRPTGRKVTDSPRSLSPGREKATPISSLPRDESHPPIQRYAYRPFDRQHILADARVLDRPGPSLWHCHSERQTYVTSFLTEVVGNGPGAVASALLPDLHHFRGSFGGKHVIPLYKNSEATEPNVTKGLLEHVAQVHSSPATPERLLAYTYCILAQPSYVERFWDELEQPPPHLPITKDASLFARVADLGEDLLYLHTYGERFSKPTSKGLRKGHASWERPVSLDVYPQGFYYDADTQTIRVGEGEHAGTFVSVAPEVWNYSVSGLQVVKAWLEERQLGGAGLTSSPLDHIRPERWEFGEELLELLWLLEETIRLQPEGEALLDEVCASPLFTADELPKPTDAERKRPQVVPGEQIDLL